jgi:hypothetical protein
MLLDSAVSAEKVIQCRMRQEDCDEWVRVWKEEVLDYLRLLSRHVPNENHEKPTEVIW